MNEVVYVLYWAVMVYTWVIVARALLSWFQLRPGTPLFSVYRVVFAITEPYLGLFRRFLPIARIGSVGLDLSAMVGIVVLILVLRLLASL